MDLLPEQRIRIGITGLAVVFLLVLVGTALTGGRGDVPEEVLASEAVETPPAEPLSELGAAPGQASEPAPEDSANPPLAIPIDPSTEELIVNEIAVPSEDE